MMKKLDAWSYVLLGSLVVGGCGDGSSSGPTPPTAPPTTSVPVSSFRIETLLTVYRSAEDLALWTQARTDDVRIGRILLGVDELAEGTTILNNESSRFELQAAIDRLSSDFSDGDYRAAFDESEENLRRFFNDADDDGWSIDGRHGPGRDWPHDEDGNDPDGWTAQMVITVTRR